MNHLAIFSRNDFINAHCMKNNTPSQHPTRYLYPNTPTLKEENMIKCFL